jgi:uncharacterized membrane protein YphA (DoxX/SURF4 family)
MSKRAIAVEVVLWIVTLFLALIFFRQGLGKFPDDGGWARAFAGWHFPVWFRYGIGVVEIAAAVLLLWPRTAFAGASLIVVTMLGGMATHAYWGHPEQMGHEALPLVLAIIVGLGRRRKFIPIGERGHKPSLAR